MADGRDLSSENSNTNISSQTSQTDKRDETIIGDVLDKLKKRGKGQYPENICEFCKREYGWSRERTSLAIELAIKQNIIKEATYGGKISYRKSYSNIPSIIIHDNLQQSKIESIDNQSQTEKGQTSDDFIDFKRKVWNDLVLLKSTLNDMAAAQPKPYPTDDSPLIRCLYERIASLERQLDDKQRIISALIEKQSPISYNSEGKIGQESGLSYEEKNKTESNNSNKSNPNNSVIEKKKAKKKNKKKRNNELHNATDTAVEKVPSCHTDTIENGASNVVDKCENEHGNENMEGPRRLNITVVGDSILNGIEEKGLSKKHRVRVRPHSGANSEDLTDHIKPIIRRKPDALIIHIGTNDLTSNIDTVKQLKSTIKSIRDGTPHTKIAVSLLTPRNDIQEGKKKVDQLNRKLKAMCIEEKVKTLDNSNIDDSCLGMCKLHQNKKGKSMLAMNLIKAMDEF